MKKQTSITKKLLSIILSAAMFAAIMPLFGCVVPDETTMDNIVGTYELTERLFGVDENGQKVDIKKENEIEAYLVINASGRGYRIYKDKNSPMYCIEVKLEFDPSDEDPMKYKHVSVYLAPSANAMMLTVKGSSQELKYSNEQWQFGSNITLKANTITYKRISDVDNLSFIEEKLGQKFVYDKFELLNTANFYYANDIYNKPGNNADTVDSEYICYYLDVNRSGAKADGSAVYSADIYYALKSDKKLVKKSNVSIDYTISSDGVAKFVIDGETYVRDKNSIVTFIKQTVIEDQNYELWLWVTMRPEDGIEAEITRQIEEYVKNNPEENPDPENPSGGETSGETGETGESGGEQGGSGSESGENSDGGEN